MFASRGSYVGRSLQLPMFLVFPPLLPRPGFWPSLGVCVIMTFILFGVFSLSVHLFGIKLL
ncbi:hypothetical protein SY86_22120 [Erwinia tracheiphila]|uniref:Uncharacterized protein n=1 Tax=Erwinia tracheiphila TaxID=65700 RepID=A0A0M2KF01_9GAMM|nr:hypothetical protein ETR_06245 [Erwinia tracheiphila PSU-1]KKF37479.1 hypothetical protein SY86_22120 [Erwinia tracheiphila]